MADDIGKMLMKQARAWGATDLRIKEGGKHPRLIGHYNGVAFMFVFPRSTSDQRAALNCLSDLRRVFGIERKEKPARRPAKQRKRQGTPKARQLPQVADPIQREDRYYAPLAQLKKSMGKDPCSKADGRDQQSVPLRTPFLGRRQRFLRL